MRGRAEGGGQCGMRKSSDCGAGQRGGGGPVRTACAQSGELPAVRKGCRMLKQGTQYTCVHKKRCRVLAFKLLVFGH